MPTACHLVFGLQDQHQDGPGPEAQLEMELDQETVPRLATGLHVADTATLRASVQEGRDPLMQQGYSLNAGVHHSNWN